MQRSPRSNAGNIYKKRLEEMQMEVPKVMKPKVKPKKKAKKTTGKKGVKTSPTATSRTSSGNRALVSPMESESEDDDYWDSASHSRSEGGYSAHSDQTSKSTKASSNTRLSKSNVANSRNSSQLQKLKNLNKFKCPQCKATFAEERYVEFHLKQVHETVIGYNEGSPRKRKTTSSRVTNQQAQAFIGHLQLKEEHSMSDVEDGEDFTMDAEHVGLDLDFPRSSHLHGAYARVENTEDYYEIQHHGDLLYYVCRSCPEFKVSSKHVIVMHVRRHMSSNYTCPYCKLKFNSRASLEVHVYSHTGVEPFCCKQCDLGFKSSEELLKHSRKGHSQNEIGEFSTSELEQPQPTHARRRQILPQAPDPPHKCPYCLERFISVVNLKTHLNIHKIKGETDEEMEKALWAEIAKNEQEVKSSANKSPTKEFDFEPPLVKRRREKEINLNLISKAMSNRGDSTMTTDNPPTCKPCNKVFLYTTNLEKHMQEVHNFPTSSPQQALAPVGGSGTLISQQSSSTRDLMPVITSVVSQAVPGVANSAEVDLDMESCSKQSVSSGIGKTNGIESLKKNTVPGSSSASTSSNTVQQPIFLVINPANNNHVPLHSFNSTQNLVSFTTSAPALENLQRSPFTDENSDETRVDDELHEELVRLGKPGNPLFQGADNQNIEHQCLICEETIVGYIEIQKHLHTHTELEFTCHLCQKSFSSKASLGVHFLTHVGITYSCPVCRKRLAKKQSLLDHIRAHKGERRFACSICGKTFGSTSTLNRHFKIHAGANVKSASSITANNFKCSRCSNTFHDEITLAHHQRAHAVMDDHSDKLISKPKPKSVDTTVAISCHYCDTMWGSISGLAKHLKKVHLKTLSPGNWTSSASPLDEIPSTSQAETLTVTDSTSSGVKFVEFIDISSDDESDKAACVNIAGSDSNVELPLTIVNVDGQDVNAIEILTTDVLGEDPSVLVDTDTIATDDLVVTPSSDLTMAFDLNDAGTHEDDMTPKTTAIEKQDPESTGTEAK